MKIQLICLLLAMAANVVSSEAAAKSSNYEVVSTEEGLKFVKWSGKKKVVDFNADPTLRQVQIIGRMAFEMNDFIEEVILPEGLQVIERRAFNTCTNLRRVEMPHSVRKIEFSAFNMCRKLQLDALPDSLQEIGTGAFWDCDGLTISAIPEKVTRIERIGLLFAMVLQNWNYQMDLTRFPTVFFSVAISCKTSKYLPVCAL